MGAASADFKCSHRLIQSAVRGSGMSDRNATRLGLDVWLKDLEAVVDGFGVDRAPFVGIGRGGPWSC